MKKIIISAFFMLALCFQVAAQKKVSGKDFVVTITVPQGEIVLMLYDVTPKHKENFLKLAQSGTYDGTTFHRIIKNFMVQGGDPNSKDSDPNNDGQGSLGYTIPAEFVDTLKHTQGALAAARMGDQVNPNKESSSCQFYIVENRSGAHFLDGSYTVFGRVIKGIDVVEMIASEPKDGRDRPRTDIKMKVSVKKMKKKRILKKYGALI